MVCIYLIDDSNIDVRKNCYNHIQQEYRSHRHVEDNKEEGAPPFSSCVIKQSRIVKVSDPTVEKVNHRVKIIVE